MTARDLLRTARDLLTDTAASLPLRKAAVEALLSAASDGLALPSGAARLIWTFWTSVPESRSWRYAHKLGDIADERIRAEAMEILERHDCGDELRDLAAEVLVGKAHAIHVDDRLLLALVERVYDESEAHRLGRLIASVHEARGVDPSILRAIRDRWSASPLVALRETSVSIAREIVEPDVAFIERMLGDPDAEVRGAMADALSMAFPGAQIALGVVEARLRVEVHPHSRAALLRAQASLIEDAAPPRHRRR